MDSGKIESTILSALRPDAVLQEIGYRLETIQRTERRWKCFCPIHKERIFRSLTIDLTTHRFSCGYNQCPGSRGGDLLDLYASGKGITRRHAIRFWAEKMDLPIPDEPEEPTQAETQPEVAVEGEPEETVADTAGEEPIAGAAGGQPAAVASPEPPSEPEPPPPEPLTARGYLARFHHLRSSGSIDEVRSLLAEAVELYPEDLDLLDTLAALRSSEDDQPGAHDALLKMASVYRRQGSKEGELRTLKRALGSDANDMPTRMAIVELCVEQEMGRDAIQYLYEGASLHENAKNIDAAIECYRQISEIDKGETRALERLAEIYAERKKVEASSGALLSLARLYEEREILGKACDAYCQLLEMNPENIEARRELAKLYSLRGKRDAAAQTLAELAAALLAAECFEEAAEALQSLLEHQPENTEARTQLAENFERLGRSEESLREYRTVAAIYDREGETGKAIELYTRIHKRRPQEREVLHRLVSLLLHNERKNETREILRRQVELEQKMGEGRHAVRWLRALLDLEPGDIETAVALARHLREDVGEDELVDFVRSHAQFLASSASVEESLKLIEALPPEIGELEAIRPIREALKPFGAPEKPTAERSLESARQALVEGLYEEARRRFHEAHELGADPVASLTGLLQTAMTTGNEAEMVSVLPELFQALEGENREDEAVLFCLEILERFPDHVGLRNQCFSSLKESGHYDQLVNALTTRLSVVPGDHRVVLELAELHLEMRNEIAALSVLDEAAEYQLQEGNPELAGMIVRRALAIESDDEKRHAALAESCARSGRIDEAAEVLVSLARRRRSQGRIPEAGHLLGRALQYSPVYLPALKEDFETSLESRDDEWVRRCARRLARAYAAAELHGKAIETLSRARRLLPEDPALMEESLSVYEEMGAVDRAVESVQELIRIRKAADEHEAVLAMCRRGLALSPTNLALWEELVRTQERAQGIEACEETYIRLADVYRDKGLNGKRLEVFARLRQAFPSSARVWNLSLEALEETGNHPEMASVLAQQARYLLQEGDLGAARETLGRALEIKPDSIGVLEALGRVCLAMEDRESAVTHFGALCEQLHSDPPPTDPSKVDLLVESYRQIIDIAPDLAQPRLRLAALLRHNRRNDDAAAVYEELAEGECFRLTVDERQQVLENIVELEPENLASAWDLALVYQEQGDRDREIEALETLSEKALPENELELSIQVRSRLTELMPGDPERWESLAQAFEQAERKEETLEALEQAAAIYLRRGDFEAAEPILVRVAEGGTESPELLAGLARAAERNGRAEEAARYLVRMADDLCEKGDTESAAEHLRHACELQPHRREYKEKLLDTLAAQKSYRRAVSMALSLVGSAQEEEQRVRILEKAVTWQSEDPEIGEALIPAFERMYPGRKGVQLLVALLSRSETLATAQGSNPVSVSLPESFLESPQFWAAFLSETKGRLLGIAQYVEGISKLIGQDEKKAAKAVCERGLEVHGDARALLERYLEILELLGVEHEEKVPVLERLCEECEQSGDREATARYRRMISPAAPEDLSAPDEEAADAAAESRQRAHQYAEAGSPHDAVVEWNKVLALVPGDVEALGQLWDMNTRIGDMESARRAGHQLAEAACLRGEAEEGIQWFQRVLERLPGDHETCQRLAELCLGLGRRGEGIEYVRRLARIYHEQGREEEEMRVLERLRLLEPEDSDLERLATLYEETDQDRALETYRTILERAERSKDVSRASSAAVALVRLAKGGGDALQGLAARFEGLDQKDQARTTYHEAAERFREAGNGMKSLECYRAAQRLGERSSDLCLTMAEIYQSFGNLVESEACLWQAWEILEADGKEEDLLSLSRRMLDLKSDNLPGLARAFSYLDGIAERLPTDTLADARSGFLEALARHPSSPRTREILDEIPQRWSRDQTANLGLLCALGDLLLEARSPEATGCWLAISRRAWKVGEDASRARALEVFRRLDLTTGERDTLIQLWVEHEGAEDVLPEMLTQVEALQRAGQPDAALEMNQQILEVAPDNDRARRALPDLLERCGDPAAGRAARLELARHFLETGNREEAIACGRDLLERGSETEEILQGVKALYEDAGYTEGLLEVGRRQVDVHLEEGRYDRAIAELEELRERAGATPELHFRMADVAKLQGDRLRERKLRREGARAFAEAEDFGRAVEKYRSILEEDAGAAEIRLDLANLLWEKGFPEDAKREQSYAIDLLLQQEKWDEAREAADALLSRAPDDLAVLESAVRWAEHDEDAERQKDLLGRLGEGLAARGELERAASVHRDLLSWVPDDLTVRKALIDLLRRLGRTQEATQELLALAQMAREQDDHVRAVASAEDAWRTNPQSREASALVVQLVEEGQSPNSEVLAGAFQTLAQSAVSLGDLEEAEDWIARAEKAGVPKQSFSEVDSALEKRRERQPVEDEIEGKAEEAEAAFEAGEVARGRKLFESLVAQCPSDLILLRRFAQALVRAGQAETAFQILQEKAESLERADDYEGSSYCLERLMNLRPDRVEPILQLARLQCLSREEQRAWNTFSRAIDIVLNGERNREDKEEVAEALRDYRSRLPDRSEVWERVFELEKELDHREQALLALKSIHRLAHQTGRTLEAVDALRRGLAVYPVRLRRDDWRAPQDWVEDDESIELVGVDGTGIEESTDLEDVRHHLRHRLELATYHLRHGLQDEGTRELVMAGEVARVQGLWKQAKRFYSESLKWLRHLGERTGHRTAWNGLLEVNMALGEADAARRTVRSWVAWEEEQGELEQALEVRKAYLETEPKDLAIREDLVARAWEWGYAEIGWEQGLILAGHLQEKDLFGRAEALYRGLLQRAKEASHAAELGGRVVEVRKPLLQLLADRGDHAAAAEIQWDEAMEAKQAGDYARAAGLLEQIRSQRPEDPALLEELIACHRQAGDEDAAFDYQMRLARFHQSSGTIHKALELTQSAVRARPEDEKALDFLTACYRQTGDISDACMFYWQTVNLLNREGRLSAAAPILHQIQDLSQRAPDNWRILAQTWSELGEKEKAGQAYYRAGSTALSAGNVEEAKECLEKAGELIPDEVGVREALEQIAENLSRRHHPDRGDDLLQAAEQARQSGDRAEACRLLDEYVTEHPDDVPAKEKLVDLFVGLTGSQDGLAGATSALSGRQRERLLHLCESLAQHYISAGETAQGVRFTKMTVELAPERNDLRRDLMEQYVSLGLQSEASRQGMELAAHFVKEGNPSAAVSVYRDLLKMDPGNVEVRNALALLLVDGEHTEEAKQQFRQLAETYAQKELLGKALSCLQSAVSLDPEDEELRQRMARLYSLKGNTGAALGELKIIEDRCRQRGELDRAADVLAEMVKLDPERGSIRERLAQTYLDLRDRRRAFETYRALAHLYHERELPGRMIEAIQKALAIDGEDRDLSRLMVEAYRDRGDVEAALGEARRMAKLAMQRSPEEGEELYCDILEWQPEDSETIQALAECCERQHRDSEASDHLEHLGRLYQSQARFLEATRMWRRALELNNRKVALKEELAEAYLDLGDEYHGHLLLEELAEHYENLGEYEEAVNRWVRLADRHIQKAMELPA